MNFKNITKSILTILFGAIVMTSCNKNDNGTEAGGTLPPQQAKEFISGTIDNFYGCMKNLNDGGFSNFFYHNFFTTAKTITKTSTYTDWNGVEHSYSWQENYNWYEFLSEKFEKKVGDLNDNEGLDYQKLKGTYVWNRNTEDWEITKGGNQVVVRFPSGKDATTNNAEIIFKDYEDELVKISSNERARLPKKGNLSVTVDNQKIFEAVLKNVKYTQQASFVVVEAAELQIFAQPLTAQLSWKHNGNNSYALNIDFSSPNGCTTKVQGSVKAKHSDFDNFNGLKEIQKVDLAVSHNEMIINVNVDVEGINNLNKDFDKLTENEFATYIKSEVYKNKTKVADLKLLRNDDKIIPYLFYSDGSMEKAEKFVADFPEKMETIFNRFIR